MQWRMGRKKYVMKKDEIVASALQRVNRTLKSLLGSKVVLFQGGTRRRRNWDSLMTFKWLFCRKGLAGREKMYDL